MKRFISLIISVLMLCSLVPVSAFAEEVTEYTYEKFKYTINDGEITIKQYTSTTDTIATVPAKIEGMPVTVIGVSAFAYKTNLQKIILPDSITRIEHRAFEACSKLTELIIPDKVTTLGIGLFEGCTALEFVYFGEGITSIPSSCFYNCSSFIGYISASPITSIGDSAFRRCTALEYVYLDDGIETIPDYLFYECSSLIYVDMPDSIKVIGTEAFYKCSSLGTINLSDELTTIKSNAFCESGLTSVVIPASVTSIGERAFAYCKRLDRYLFKGYVPYLTSTFYLSTAIEYAIIPEGTTNIDGCFWDCRSLKKAYIPTSIKEIYSSSFFGCSNLTDIYYAGTEEEWNEKLQPYGDFDEKVTIHFNAVPADVADDYVAEVDGVEYIVPAKETIYLDIYEGLVIDNLCYVFVQWEIDYGNITFEDVTSAVQTIVMPAEDFCVRSVFRLVADLNGDEKVNARDKAALTSLIKSDSFDEYADINLDGKVNARDKAAVAEIIKGNYDYAPYFEAE